MHLASLNIDVLFHLIKIVDPVSRFNLILSGILNGFENVSKVISVEHRITNFHAVLRPCRDRMGQLEIRSLKFFDHNEALQSKCYEIFKRLVDDGVLKNNLEMSVTCYSWSHIPQLLENICSMKKLHTLELSDCEITLEQLSTLFRSCPDLVELSMELDVEQKLEMDDNLKNDLRRGFQKLKILIFYGHIDNDSWPAIKEIVTWLKECVELNVKDRNYDFMNPICGIDRSLSQTLNPTLAQNLRSLTLDDTSVEFIQLILPSCLHIYTLDLGYMYEGMDAFVKIDRLKKLKKLRVSGRKSSHFREILRNCHQVEILNIYFLKATLKDLTDLAAENVKEVDLSWEKGPSIEKVLPVVAKWRQLQKLTLFLDERNHPSSEVFCNFIMGMKHLTHLRFFPYSSPKLKPLRKKINEFVSRHRPNFDLK